MGNPYNPVTILQSSWKRLQSFKNKLQSQCTSKFAIVFKLEFLLTKMTFGDTTKEVASKTYFYCVCYEKNGKEGDFLVIRSISPNIKQS